MKKGLAVNVETVNLSHENNFGEYVLVLRETWGEHSLLKWPFSDTLGEFVYI